VAKILVADDNSNVQKTVALALADLGVEVVGVNNGEAAVRKLGDISPDLVLADIFMPVRNGYEVCEFVKRDSRFSNIPVVLLVGAFDPLDEREAQRVNADGILKKPFVPPDPLIAMVKTLLDRTIGERLVTVGAAKPTAAAQNKAGGGVAIAEKPSTAPEPSEEVPLQEFHPPVDRISFGEGEAPVAFQQLLEAAAQAPATPAPGVVEPLDDDQILTSSRPSSLGDPIFWRTESPKEENAEENSESDEESDISLEMPMRAWTPDSGAKSHSDAEEMQPVESFELVRDETEEEAKQAPTIAESSSLIVQDAASQASLNVEAGKPEDLAANPIEWMASVPPPPTEETPEETSDWPAADMAAISGQKPDAAESDELKNNPIPISPESAPKIAAPVVQSVPKSEPPPFPTPAQPPIKPSTVGLEDKASSIPKEDWADLATSLQGKSTDSITGNAKAPVVPVVQPPALNAKSHESATVNSAPPASKPPAKGPNDTDRSLPKHDWADLAESLEPERIDHAAEQAKSLPIPPTQNPAVTGNRAESVPPISKPLTQNTGDTARSMPKQELDDFAASLPHKPSENASEKSKPTPAAQAPAMNSAPPAGKSSAQRPEDTARSIPKHDWADLSASVPSKTVESVVVKPRPAGTAQGQVSAGPSANSQPASSSHAPSPTASTENSRPEPTNSTTPGSPDPALVEAVVQRVLEKMRPQVVDIITKEFLRPVVQALVHREITKR
jgi:CheY-like chemotaxis protein